MSQDIKKINGVYMGSQEIASTRFATSASAYYKLEDVNDSSGNGYNLTNNGTVTFSAAKFGNGASFNGTTQSLTIADGSYTNAKITGAQTWLAWVNVASTDASNEGTIMGICNSGSSALIRISTTTSGTKKFYVQATLSSGNTGAVLSSTVYSYNVWYHLALQFTGTSMSIFVNGVQENTVTFASSTVNAITSSLGIGILGSSSSYPNRFNGMIDEAYITPSALTSDEIYSLYKTGVKKLNGVDNLTTPSIKKVNGVSNV